jgi:hypothetical protein
MRFTIVMNMIPKLALGALMIFSPGLLDASPYRYDPVGPRGHGQSILHPGYRPAPPRIHTPPRHHRAPRVEVEAQIRLRQLGYYRGTIDGLIGRGTRSAIVRFQRDYRLPATGYLDHRTLRALGVIRR